MNLREKKLKVKGPSMLPRLSDFGKDDRRIWDGTGRDQSFPGVSGNAPHLNSNLNLNLNLNSNSVVFERRDI